MTLKPNFSLNIRDMDKDQLQYDYCTYAPVVSSTITRLFFLLAAYYGWDI